MFVCALLSPQDEIALLAHYKSSMSVSDHHQDMGISSPFTVLAMASRIEEALSRFHMDPAKDVASRRAKEVHFIQGGADALLREYPFLEVRLFSLSLSLMHMLM